MDYISEVAECLQNSIGSSILGPETYTIIAEWEKREIPPEIVKKSIEQIVRGNSKLRSALEIDEIVSKNFEEHLRSGLA